MRLWPCWTRWRRRSGANLLLVLHLLLLHLLLPLSILLHLLLLTLHVLLLPLRVLLLHTLSILLRALCVLLNLLLLARLGLLLLHLLGSLLRLLTLNILRCLLALLYLLLALGIRLLLTLRIVRLCLLLTLRLLVRNLLVLKLLLLSLPRLDLLLLAHILLILLVRRHLALLLLPRLQLARLLLQNGRIYCRRPLNATVCRKPLPRKRRSWLAMVLRERLRPVLLRLLAKFHLRTHRRRRRLPRRQPLLHRDRTAHSTCTVEARACVVPVGVVDRHVPHIDVVLHHAWADVVHRLVVLEAITVPIAAEVSDTDVTKAIVNAAVKTNVRSPVSMMEAVLVAVVSPPAGSPKRALVRCGHPCTRHPVVPAAAVAPVSRRPKIVWSRSVRLLIDRQRRRRLRSGRDRVVDVLSIGVRAILVGRIVARLLLRVVTRLQALVLTLGIVFAVLRGHLGIALPRNLRSLRSGSLHRRARGILRHLQHIRRSRIGSIRGGSIFDGRRHQRSLLVASHQHHGKYYPS